MQKGKSIYVFVPVENLDESVDLFGLDNMFGSEKKATTYAVELMEKYGHDEGYVYECTPSVKLKRGHLKVTKIKKQ